MSTERYAFDTDEHGCLVLIGRGGARIQARDGGPVAHAAFAAIRQQSADIAELKVDVSGLRSSEAVLKFECDQLRTKLGEMVGRSKASRDDLHRGLGRTDDTIIRLEHELSLSRLATERHKTHIDQCGEELKTTRADLAAAVAERDEWKECAMSNLDERDKLRARLAAIDGAPTVALTFCHPYSHEEPGQLIARPARD